MAATLYGFKSCDTVRKGMKWLEENKVDYDFFDYRKNGIDPVVVDRWFARAGWENVFNRSSASFRNLTGKQRAELDEASAKALILADTNFIKRPLLETDDAIVPGFKPQAWAAALA